jgi:hypothetical protein
LRDQEAVVQREVLPPERDVEAAAAVVGAREHARVELLDVEGHAGVVAEDVLPDRRRRDPGRRAVDGEVGVPHLGHAAEAEFDP